VTDQDPHSPTTAATEATFTQPPGSAILGGGPSGASGTVDERPELLVGAAFAGGIVAAMVLKRIFRRD
jgi:hypothetical protein